MERLDRSSGAWARRAGILLAVLALSACGSEVTANEAELAYADFVASLEPGPRGGWIVDTDIVIRTEESLREYFFAYEYEPTTVLHDESLGLSQGSLVVRRTSGVDRVHSESRRRSLTYCVTDDFGDDHDDVVAAFATAAASWEAILDVDFRHVAAEDDDCDDSNTAVFFDIVPSGDEDSGWANSFWPDESRANREITLGGNARSSALMTHELGHALGFRHEHGRPTSETGLGAGCVESGGRVLTPYDDRSVMHYPSYSSTCPGADDRYRISRLDTLAAQSFYDARRGTCTLAGRDICDSRGASCEQGVSVSGDRFDMCRWNAGIPLFCTVMGGIWTTADSDFARNVPGSVPAGQDAACLSQVSNLGCSAADQALCLLHGATCDRAYSTSGSRHDLCRWHTATTRAQCDDTDGIWTTRDSGFARGWPTAVAWTRDASCVTQTGNLR